MSYILFFLKKDHLPPKSATASSVVAIKVLVIINDYPNQKVVFEPHALLAKLKMFCDREKQLSL